ncbi:MAG: BamA/TamA family outer membrane protein, partial [Bacteroidota bacterium]
FDFRHYQRLDKRSIFAVRMAGATSFGSERILYQLGGVDQWLFPRFNQNIPLPPDENLAFHVPVSNLRGFELNIRNGNSYVLLNNEVRIPVLSYLSKKNTPFFRNFQLVGFFDAGTAWTGVSPFSEESPLNTSTYASGPVQVRVNYFRDPIVAGYGFGVRTMLFGYFLRIDRGWGIETRTVQDPRWYFSFGTDF